VAALGIGGYALLSNDDNSSASPGGASTAALPVVPIPSLSLPSISIPSISIPSIDVPSLPSLPSGTSFSNPCSLAGAPAQAATIYVGLAEIGQTANAQACVYRTTVPSSVTASIGAGQGSSHLYVPSSGGTGSVFTFTTVDGSSRLQVTITKESDGKLYVTRVHTS
jgi:hypothetical protein